jgi:alkylated DNA repair protein (DNA oxidative demethylase)
MPASIRGTALLVPEGVEYRPGFLGADEERELVARVSAVAYGEVRMHGVVARRKTAHFGHGYVYTSRRSQPADPIPVWLAGLSERVAPLLGGAPEEVLLTEYPAGAGIGWHKDAPMFGPTVVGVSLLAPCTMRFRRGAPGARETAALRIVPRSLYVLGGPARSEWQHTIPSTPELRYSITFRRLR